MGTYKTSSGNKQNNLSRRTFTSTGSIEVSGDSVIEPFYYGEGATQDKYGEPITTGTKSQIETFKIRATNKSGFYIGRYEAGTEIERTSSFDTLTTPLIQANKNPYVYITRDQAREKSEAMYIGNSYVTSELISSYAWDTALNFICQINGYSLATTTSKDSANINTNKKELTGAYKVDKYSNIYDILGNVEEWSNEYSNYTSFVDGTSIIRGGFYQGNYSYAGYRTYNSTGYSYNDLGFRIQLYIN